MVPPLASNQIPIPAVAGCSIILTAASVKEKQHNPDETTEETLVSVMRRRSLSFGGWRGLFVAVHARLMSESYAAT